MWRPGQPRRSPTKNLVPMVRTWPHKLHETASQPHPFPNTAQKFEQTTRLAAIYQPPVLPRLRKGEARRRPACLCWRDIRHPRHQTEDGRETGGAGSREKRQVVFCETTSLVCADGGGV